MDTSGSISGDILDNRTRHILLPPGSDPRIAPWQEKLDGILPSLSDKLDRFHLKPLLQLLVAALNPEQIYMIDHRSLCGDTTHTIDLLIVVTNDCNIPELEPLLQIAALKDQRVRCSLHNRQKLLHAMQHEHVFYTLHCTPQNLVYDNKRVTFPLISTERRAELNAYTSHSFSQRLGAADRFLICAENTRSEGGQSGLAGFFVHQGVETVYRSLIKVLDGYDKKCHHIRALQKRVRICAPQLNAIFSDSSAGEQRLLDLLEDCYIRGRYDDTFTIPDAELDTLIAKGRALKDAAARIMEDITS